MFLERQEEGPDYVSKHGCLLPGLVLRSCFLCQHSSMTGQLGRAGPNLRWVGPLVCSPVCSLLMYCVGGLCG